MECQCQYKSQTFHVNQASFGCVNNFNNSFFGKIYHFVEEKDNPLGFEPVLECLPSARFKSRKNVVH